MGGGWGGRQNLDYKMEECCNGELQTTFHAHGGSVSAAMAQNIHMHFTMA